MARSTIPSTAHPLDLWGQDGSFQQEVVGESRYFREIRNLFGSRYDPAGVELFFTAQLVPEPDNRYDPNAVSVRINGLTVGYLPREDAARYAPVFSSLIHPGWLPQVSARVWGGDRVDVEYDRGRTVEVTRFIGSVSLDLGEPHLLVPANRPPAEPYAILPYGNPIQVFGEEKHMATLTPLLSSAGECWIHTTLHEVVEQSARSVKTLVEVRVDGNVVGRLSPAMSEQMLPIVRFLAERRVLTVARAILKGNTLKAEVVLRAARASQIPQSWLDAPPLPGMPEPVMPAQVTPATAVDTYTTAGPPPAPVVPPPPDVAPHPAYARSGPPTTWRFNPPPGWPPPPPGWTPPTGWQPDPSWPPPPPGWQFWVA